ncbi:23483_t:CDS:2, partial [Gigaspora rosea]
MWKCFPRRLELGRCDESGKGVERINTKDLSNEVGTFGSRVTHLEIESGRSVGKIDSGEIRTSTIDD